MSTTAVIMCNTLARDEFERDWHGYEEFLEFLEGNEFLEPPLPPVEHLEATIGGVQMRFNAGKVKEVLLHRQELIRYEVEEEVTERNELEDDDDFSVSGWFHKQQTQWWSSEEGIEAKIQERLEAYWHDQLEGEDEWMAVIDCHGHYAVEATKEFVAYMDMIMERQPATRPYILEKMAEVQAHWEQTLGETLKRMQGD
jgi:hypothetical protein